MSFELALKTFPLFLTFGGWVFATRFPRLKDIVLGTLALLFCYETWMFFNHPITISGTYSLFSLSFNRPSLFVGMILSGALFMGLYPVRKDLALNRNFLLYLTSGMGIILADNLPTFFVFFFLQRGIPFWNFVKNIRNGDAQSGGTYMAQHLLALIAAVLLMIRASQQGVLLSPLMEFPKEFFTKDVIVLCFALIFQAHGIFPFHSWVHDLVDNVRWYEISVLFLPLSGVLLFVQMMVPQYGSVPDSFKIFLLALSIFSSIYWSFRGIYENNVQKEVTYFYIAQASLVLTGMQATHVALLGSYLHMMVVSLSGTALWSILSYIQGHVSLKKHQSFYGLAQDFPLLATMFCLFGFCLIGVPLLASFVAEDLVINGLLDRMPYLGLGHIFAGCLNGILFFLLFSKLFLGNNPGHGKIKKLDLSLGEMFPYLVSFIIMLLIGILPFLFLENINW